MVTLSNEQRQAIISSNGCPLVVRDSESTAQYVLVDEVTHRKAMEALRRQQDMDAIARGIANMEAGRVLTRDEMDQRMFEEFGFPLGKPVAGSVSSIQRGIGQMEAGLGRPAAESEAIQRAKHGFPPRKK